MSERKCRSLSRRSSSASLSRCSRAETSSLSGCEIRLTRKYAAATLRRKINPRIVTRRVGLRTHTEETAVAMIVPPHNATRAASVHLNKLGVLTRPTLPGCEDPMT